MKNKRGFSLVELSIVIIIIGIVIAGVTKGRLLISSSKLSSARAVTKGSPVPSIKGLLLWYDVTSQASFDEEDHSDGTQISNWYDLNPALGKTHASSSGTARPIYKTSCINGLPCLSFDGTDDYLETTDLGAITTTATYFIVMRPTAVEVSTPVIFSTYGLYSAANDSAFLRIINSGQLQYGVANSVPATSTNVVLKNDLSYIITATDGGLESDIKIYHNSLENTTAATGSTSSLKNLGVLTIGSYFNETTRSMYFQGYIGEFLIYNRALTALERKDIENYLRKKWQIASQEA